jgi:hypothetical protein
LDTFVGWLSESLKKRFSIIFFGVVQESYAGRQIAEFDIDAQGFA